MTVRARRAKKPELLSEVLRTLQAYDLLAEGLKQRRALISWDHARILAIAERIAARTSEEE